MSLKSIYTWNEDDTSNSRDYSTIGNDSTAMVVTSIVAAEIDKAVNLDGVNDVITFGDINNFGGTDSMAIFLKVRPTSSKVQVLAHKSGQYSCELDASQKAVFKVTVGASEFTFTSSGQVATGGAYKTVAFVYDGRVIGSGMSIFIDGILDGSQAQTGNLDASASNFLIGSDLTSFYDGRMEMLSADSTFLSATKILAMHNRPAGILLNLADSTKYSVGDLLELGNTTATSQGVITGDLGSNQILYLPINGDIPKQMNIIRHRGNVFDTTRQHLSEQVVESDDITIQIKDRVDNFTKATPSTEGTKGFKYNKDALRWKMAICPDFVIEPAAQVGSINDFSPTDIVFANTLYISSTSPVSWTGLLAPSPVKPQLIFIINTGSFNITIRNNSASSVAENRFSINTNVILSPNDCGYVLYDETRSRWRVNKI